MDHDVPPDFGLSEAAQPRGPLGALPRFVFAHHPDRWIVRDGAIVPDLAAIPIEPNVDGVRLKRVNKVDSRGRPVTAELIAVDLRQRLSDEGWTVISDYYACSPDGLPYTKRVAETPDGIGKWTDRWTTCYDGQELRSCDASARSAWAGRLVSSGLIAEPRPHVLERLLAQTRIAASRAAKSQREGANQQADALRAECDLIAKAIVKASSKSKPIAGSADVPES
jgi:hypothetical protein